MSPIPSITGDFKVIGFLFSEILSCLIPLPHYCVCWLLFMISYVPIRCMMLHHELIFSRTFPHKRISVPRMRVWGFLLPGTLVVSLDTGLRSFFSFFFFLPYIISPQLIYFVTGHLYILTYPLPPASVNQSILCFYGLGFLFVFVFVLFGFHI